MPPNRTYDDEISLSELYAILRSGLKEIIAIALFAGAATYLISVFLEPTYRATATLVVSSRDATERDFGTTLVTAPSLDIGTYRTALSSRRVLTDALQRLDGATPTPAAVAALENAVSITASGTSQSAIREIRADDPEAGRARDLANAVAAAAIGWDERRTTEALGTIIASLQAQIVAIDAELAAASPDDAAGVTGPASAQAQGLQNRRADLALQLSSARALRTAAVGRLELLESAVAPAKPVSPRPLLAALLATVIAGLASVLLVFLRETLSNRVRDVDDLGRITGLPVLTEFPAVATGRRGLPREAASYLRTSVDFATTDAHPKVFLVTSTDARHGKSSVAIALSESYARQGHRVLLMDADLRKPVLGTEYGLRESNIQDLRKALEHPDEVRPTMIDVASGVSVDVLPGFQPAPDPTELLGHGMRPLLDHVASQYDVIVIDTAPVIPVADTLSIAPFTTGLIFATSLPDADRKAITNALNLLRRLNVKLLGVVATNVKHGASHRSGAYGYGYGYGTGYGSEHTTTDTRPHSTTTAKQRATGGARRPARDATAEPRP